MRKIKLPNIHKNTWFIQWFSQGLGFVCTLGKRWHWGYCLTRCTNTPVQHACIGSISSWHMILIFAKDIKSPAASQLNVPRLGTLGKPFVCAAKTECVFIWACWTDSVPCQSDASAVTVWKKTMGTNLHLINPTSPPSSSWKTPLSPPPPPPL